MRRPVRASRFILTGTLAAAVAVALPSCRPEERAMHVVAAREKATRGTPNTPIGAGGPTQPLVVGFEPAAPEPSGLESTAAELAQGALLYRAMNCAGCHAAHGGGGIGPALMDDEWIYGWKPEIVFNSIVYGRPNGMPSFGGRISDRQVWQLVAYVRSLSGLTSSDAAPGRDEHMAGAPPPNSIARAHPRTSTSQLDELRLRDREEFERLGWVDPRSGKVGIPESPAPAVARRIAPTTTTRPASNPTPTTRPSGLPRRSGD
jgi:cytochrome c oxidase cbb3-type subunit 3